MDMDSMIFEMRENELKSMKELLAQYQKELCDLKAGIGSAKTMNKKDIFAAEKNLEDKIESLVENILQFEEKYSYAI